MLATLLELAADILRKMPTFKNICTKIKQTKKNKKIKDEAKECGGTWKRNNKRPLLKAGLEHKEEEHTNNGGKWKMHRWNQMKE